MKTTVRFLGLCLLAFLIQSAYAQVVEPDMYFFENPLTHNMHICSDGEYFYTVNGGRADMGLICRYTLKGKKIAGYPVELDMRSIMYNPADKKLYVNTYERDMYCIDDLENGIYTVVSRELLADEQSTPAVSPDGKKLYELSNGTLHIYDFVSGEILNTVTGLKAGSDNITGSTTVAVDKNFIYTWDAGLQEIYLHSHDGVFLRSMQIGKGDYGFSLSVAGDYIFVSMDGDYGTGTWFAYKAPKK